MKRQCLLSRAYTGDPMTLDGVELIYSPLVNELMREFETRPFFGNSETDQTDHGGITECVMVMKMVSTGDKAGIANLRTMSRKERNSEILSFMLEYDADIEILTSQIMDRLKAIQAAMVESEGVGKSHPPLPVSSQP